MTKENVVLTSEQREVLKGYKQEVFEALTDEQIAKDHFKNSVELAAEATGLEKSFISGFFKDNFNAKVDSVITKAEWYKFFNE